MTSFQEIIQTPNLYGLNVTIPYKQDVIPLLDAIDPIAQAIGAVNVIAFDAERKCTGYNSDYYGIWESVQPLLGNISQEKRMIKALILGTGGASKAVAFALDYHNISYQYVSRTKKEHTITYEEVKQNKLLESYHLVINCSPLGTFPDIQAKPDLDYSQVTSKHIFYDLIYNPDQTAFMKQADLKGAVTSNGLRMLELQALKAWEIWNR